MIKFHELKERIFLTLIYFKKIKLGVIFNFLDIVLPDIAITKSILRKRITETGNFLDSSTVNITP